MSLQEKGYKSCALRMHTCIDKIIHFQPVAPILSLAEPHPLAVIWMFFTTWAAIEKMMCKLQRITRLEIALLPCTMKI